jgi:hypothetical protein
VGSSPIVSTNTATPYPFGHHRGGDPGGDEPLAKTKPPIVPEKPVPVLTADQLEALFVTTIGKSFIDRRDEAILRLFAARPEQPAGDDGQRHRPDGPPPWGGSRSSGPAPAYALAHLRPRLARHHPHAAAVRWEDRGFGVTTYSWETSPAAPLL